MPTSRASRGEEKATGWPSTRYAPLVGWWTPASVLISVDLPAPLSPSRHITSPRPTVIDTPERAITEPKCLMMLRTSMRGVSFAISALPSDLLTDEVVEEHCKQQHRAEKHLEPVRVEARVGQADRDHPEDDRPEECANRRPVAAGQETPADDGRDYGLEFLLKPAPRVRRASIEHCEHSDEGRRTSRQHE